MKFFLAGVVVVLTLGVFSAAKQMHDQANKIPMMASEPEAIPVIYHQDAVAPNADPEPPPIAKPEEPRGVVEVRRPDVVPPLPPRQRLYGCVDATGVTWTHTDPAYLQQYVMGLNASRATVAAPVYQPTRRGFFGRSATCTTGSCPQ